MGRLAALAVLLVGIAASRATADVVLSTCGQVIPPDTVARLAADLDCSGTSDGGAVLGDGATLDLAGFTLRGNPSAPLGTNGVTCAGGCTRLGPGSIEDFAGDAMYSTQRATIRILGATIRRNRNRGIETLGGRMIVVGALFAENAGEAVYTGGSVTAVDTTFYGNGGGISCLTAKVNDSGFFNNGVGVSASRGRARRSTFTSNNIGLQATKAVSLDSTFTGNNIGINGNVVKVTGSKILDGTLDGIDAGKLRIVNSTATGNGTGCTNPAFPCADLATRELPTVVDTTCDRSLAWQTHQPWDVCSLD